MTSPGCGELCMRMGNPIFVQFLDTLANGLLRDFAPCPIASSSCDADYFLILHFPTIARIYWLQDQEHTSAFKCAGKAASNCMGPSLAMLTAAYA